MSFTCVLIDGQSVSAWPVPTPAMICLNSHLVKVWNRRRGDAPPHGALVTMITPLRAITEPCCARVRM
jgi:hypothetical protein